MKMGVKTKEILVCISIIIILVVLVTFRMIDINKNEKEREIRNCLVWTEGKSCCYNLSCGGRND